MQMVSPSEKDCPFCVSTRQLVCWLLLRMMAGRLGAFSAWTRAE
jgi:hypothetical protein